MSFVKKTPFLIFTVFAFLIVNCASTSKQKTSVQQTPDWITKDISLVYNKNEYIAAKGNGNTEEFAKYDALNKLSQYFKTNVHSEGTAFRTVIKDSFSASAEQKVSVKSDADIFFVEYEHYYDEVKDRYYSVAYINRVEAFNIISQKLSFYEQDFSQKTKVVKTETDDFRKVMILNDAISNEKEINTLYEYSLFMNSQKTRKFDDFRSQIIKTKNTLYELKQKNPVSVFSNGDYAEQIKSIISEILTENGFVLSKNAAYKISADSSFIITEQIAEQNEIFSCKPRVSVLIEGKSGTISSCVLSSEKISSYNKQTLIRMALSETEKLLHERLFQDLLK